jgi:hypothetical protein
VVTPTDRVRWPAIIAGLVTALSTLAVLGVLGSAIGASAYDPGDSARNFGIGAGIWGILSVLIAFFIGGWLAARSAAVAGRHNGLLNGALVWAVAIPLMAYVMAGLVGRAVDTGVQAGAAAADAAASAQQANGQSITDQAQQAAAQVGEQARTFDTEQAADRTATSAWTTLVGLLLSLGAAAGGGYVGARGTDRDRDYDHDRGTTTGGPATTTTT